MLIKMKHTRYRGEAKVLPENQAVWEAAGWVAEPKKKTITIKDDET